MIVDPISTLALLRSQSASAWKTTMFCLEYFLIIWSILARHSYRLGAEEKLDASGQRAEDDVALLANV